MYSSTITFLILFLFCLLDVQNINAQDSLPADPDTLALQQYIYNKCYLNSKNAADYQRLSADATELVKRFKYAFKFLPNDKKTFCKSERPALTILIDAVAEDLKPCLSPEEQNMPNSIRNSLKEFLHFMCHNKGENINNFFSTQGSQCRNAIETDSTNAVENCFSKIFSPAKQGFVSDKEFCDDLSVARRCFDSILDQKCPNFRAFKELNSNLFRYISKPCSGCLYGVNNLLLIFSALFLWYKMN